eukprot:3740787-Alexandrium_andersonii.AAC.1
MVLGAAACAGQGHSPLGGQRQGRSGRPPYEVLRTCDVREARLLGRHQACADARRGHAGGDPHTPAPPGLGGQMAVGHLAGDAARAGQ